MNLSRLLNGLNEGYNIQDFLLSLFCTISNVTFCFIYMFLFVFEHLDHISCTLLCLLCVCVIETHLSTPPPLMNSSSLLNESNETYSELLIFLLSLVSLCSLFSSVVMSWTFFITNVRYPLPLYRMLVISAIVCVMLCRVSGFSVLSCRVFLGTCAAFWCVFLLLLCRGLFTYLWIPVGVTLLLLRLEIGVAFGLSCAILVWMVHQFIIPASIATGPQPFVFFETHSKAP